MNFSRMPGAEPRKDGSSGVSVATGAMAQTRIPSGASSTASDLVKTWTAPFGGVIGRQPGAWTQSGGRSDINDDAPAPLAERRDNRLTSEENPFHIDGENSVVI